MKSTKEIVIMALLESQSFAKGRTIIFLPGGSHFGKINCLYTTINEKIFSRKISFKKLFAQH